jgi:mono/diheme cytochrome c family protein
MTTSTTTLSVTLSLALSLLIAGCSSSQQPASTEAPTTDVSTDPEVNAILQSSCFQCHSSSGSAPWYAAVSPTYLAANSARGVLNFSDWQTYDAEKRAAELKSIEQAVSGGSMPPGDYTALDHMAQLSDDQKQILLKWAAQPAH